MLAHLASVAGDEPEVPGEIGAFGMVDGRRPSASTRTAGSGR